VPRALLYRDHRSTKFTPPITLIDTENVRRLRVEARFSVDTNLGPWSLYGAVSMSLGRRTRFLAMSGGVSVPTDLDPSSDLKAVSDAACDVGFASGLVPASPRPGNIGPQPGPAGAATFCLLTL